MKVMRLRHAKLIVILVVIANLILFYYSWKSTIWKNLTSTIIPNDAAERAAAAAAGIDNELIGAGGGAAGRAAGKSSRDKMKNANKHIRKSITVVFRSFYNFENDLKASIDNLLDIVPNLAVVVLLEGAPYPPVLYERNITGSGEENTVRFLNLGFDVQKTPEELNALAAIHTKYVLFLPDSVRLTSKNLLQKILREINSAVPLGAGIAARAPLKAGDVKHQQEAHALIPPVGPEETVKRMVIIPFAGNMKSFSSCTQIILDLPNWTIQYVAVNSSDKCDLYIQKHAILVDVGVLKELPDPFASPFPEMFYIQAKLAGISKTVFPQAFQDGRRLFASYHTKQRRTEIRRRQFKELYKKLQIKRIIRRSHKVISKTDTKEGGGGGSGSHHNIVLDTQFSSSNFSLPLVTEIDLIGCERTTKSCVGTVYNNRPFYIYLNKHTPPCCLDKLKTTFNHVLEEFENVGIRYWLDNQALKTAIETNHLHPDAYEVDISFNVNDLERSNSMKKSQNKPFVDNEGFYWIKATDGHYFKVQFSKINQIGVNLLPFEISGNEVRPSGFFGWKAKEFSADYLHPMSTVLFLGKNIMCPNNVREFLDFKNVK